MKTALMIFSLMLSVALYAQADPVAWNFTAKKISAGAYEIHLTATVAAPWHIYSQHTPAGGPVPSEIVLSKNPMISLSGTVEEKGTQIKKHEEVFKIDVLYYNGQVDFIQKVEVKGKIKTNINGSVKFMVCNDKECLAPKTIPFQIELK